MEARQQTKFFTLFIAILIGIATTSVVSTFTTQYAEIICQAVENNNNSELPKTLHTSFCVPQTSISTPCSQQQSNYSTHYTTKRTYQTSFLSSNFSNLSPNFSLLTQHSTLSTINSALIYSHQPPLYYIFALHRMRN